MRAVSFLLMALLLSQPAYAQEAFFGKAPPTAEVATRVEPESAKIWVDAFFVRRTAREIDVEIRKYVENKLRADSEGGALELKADARGQETPARLVGDKWIANYRLTVGGISISAATQVSSTVLEDGSSAIVRERNTPKRLNFDPRLGKSATRIPLETAVSSARRELARLAEVQKTPLNVEALQVRDPEIEVWVDPTTGVGKLAWTFRLRSEEGTRRPFDIAIWVDALQDSAEVFEVKQLIRYQNRGRVTGGVWDPTPAHATKVHPIASAQVVRSAGQTPGPNDTAITDNDGKFAFSAGSGRGSFSVRLANKHFVIVNDAGDTINLKQDVGTAQGIELVYGSMQEFDIAQPSAFYWANRARDFVSAVPVLQDNALLTVKIRVNFDDECDSKWDPSANAIKLFRSSSPGSSKRCVNHAYLDSVFHEFGHAVHEALALGLGGIPTGPDTDAYAEGLADSLAILFKVDSCFGADAFAPGFCLRDAANPPVLYPANGGSRYLKGRIYSGFTWELLQRLMATYSRADALAIARRLTLMAAATNPSSIESAVKEVLLADDKDNNLINGTPHSRQIAAAARARNIPLPHELPPQS